MKVGFLNEIIKDMEAGVFDYTKNGECSNCGNCCSDFLPISPEEIRRIEKYIKKHGIKEQKHFLPTAIVPMVDMVCPFRSNAECSVLSMMFARPSAEISGAISHGKRSRLTRPCITVCMLPTP